MPRFLVVEREPISHDIDNQTRTLFKKQSITEETATATATATTVADQKGGPLSVDRLTVGWNDPTVGREEFVIDNPMGFFSAVYKNSDFTGLTAYQVEAKDELDLYYQMVIFDKHFNLGTFLAFSKMWQPSKYNAPSTLIYYKSELVLVSAVLNQIDPEIKKELLEGKCGVEFFPTAAARPWITPELAKQMWLIYNDPRGLLIKAGSWNSAAGFNCATPDKDATYARIIPMDTLPCLKSLTSVKSLPSSTL